MLRRLLPLALLLALAVPASASAAKLTCKSGHTVFAQGGSRIFSRTSKYDYGTLHKFYVCSAALRHPHAFDDDYYVDAGFQQWHVSGHYIAYAISWEDGVEAGWDAAWVDLNTGRRRGHGISPDTPVPRGDILGTAVDDDGSMAVLQTDATHKALVVWVQNGVHAMHSPRALTTLDDDIDRASLSVADGLVSWKTTAGVVGSVSAR